KSSREYGRERRLALCLALSFIVHHKECLVAAVVELRDEDRPIQLATELIQMERWLRERRGSEEIACVQDIVKQKLPRRAVKLLRAVLGDHVKLNAQPRPLLRQLVPVLNRNLRAAAPHG